MENMAAFCRQYFANKHCVALKFLNTQSLCFVYKTLDCLESKSIKKMLIFFFFFLKILLLTYEYNFWYLIHYFF